MGSVAFGLTPTFAVAWTAAGYPGTYAHDWDEKTPFHIADHMKTSEEISSKYELKKLFVLILDDQLVCQMLLKKYSCLFSFPGFRLYPQICGR